MKNYSIIVAVFILSINFLISREYSNCIADPSRVERQEYLDPEQLQSQHFVIHFTVADDDYQIINGVEWSLQSNFSFAQSILDLMEIALTKYIEDGWELPPPDCDETITDINSSNHCINYGGNSLYDIYISNDGVGMVVPERSYPVEPYTSGMTSYMKMSTMLNEHNSLPGWAHHVVAHELHHSIQLRYGYSTSGAPGNYMHNGWFFEQSASYMENVVFPYNTHLQTMLANCNVVTPLTYPEHGIDYPAELYQYRSALWHKFLVESQGDSSIVKLMWEDYGLEFATGNPVSLFPIYDNAIRAVSNDEYSISAAYKDYAIWRYFTGNRSISNQYFNESSSYCTTTSYILNDYIDDISFSNKGGTSFVELPLDNPTVNFYSDFFDQVQLSYLSINQNNQISVESLESTSSEQNYNFNTSDILSHVFIVSPIYNGVEFQSINFDVSLSNIILGDANFDQIINVLDVVILVNFAIGSNQPTDLDIEVCDFNFDGIINVLDVVQLINLILT